MNCWSSVKYVHLLYMYSILGRGCFCFNYWLNSAWHGGDQFVALLRWCEAQVSLTVAFSLSAFFSLLFLIFLLTIHHRFSMFRSGEFAGQSSTQHHGHLTSFWCFWQCGQVPNPAENEISIFKKPLGNSPVLLLLAQVRRLWRQLYPNSSTRLCVVLLMPWPQPQSIPCEVHPNSWIDFAWQSS